jgi:tetratricopeptide (TPR) repeat protein
MIPRQPLRSTLPTWADGLLVALLGVLVFQSALDGGFLRWDDYANFLQNPRYRGLGASQLGWMLTTYHMGHWKPLTWLTHALDWTLWGVEPRGYKATSIALHILASIAFLLLARRLLCLALARPLDASIRVGTLGAALLFAVHPLRVEPVAWLSARADLVAALFVFLTLLAYLRAQTAPPHKRVWQALALACFALALAGKPMAVTLPAVLLVLDVYPLRRLGPAGAGWRGAAARRVYLEKAPYLVLALLAAFLAIRARIEFSLIELTELGFPERLAAAVYALAFHLAITVLPLDLSPAYDLRAVLAQGAWRFVASGALVLALTALAVARARRWPAFAAAWAVYLIVLLPVSGLAQSGPQIAADRYTYLACAGFALLAGGGLAWCAAEAGRHAPRRVFARCVLALAGVSIVLLSIQSTRQTRVWHDTLSLWSHAAAVAPDSSLAHAGLGNALFSEGESKLAAVHFRQALALRPGLPDAEMGLALILSRQGQLEESIRYGRLALAHDSYSAGYRRIMAEIFWQFGQREEALAALEEAHRIEPETPRFPYITAVRLAQMGRSAEAVASLERGHRLQQVLDPTNPESDRYAALVYEWIDPAQAIAAWRRYVDALRRSPRPSEGVQAQIAEATAALERLERRHGAAAAQR